MLSTKPFSDLYEYWPLICFHARGISGGGASGYAALIFGLNPLDPGGNEILHDSFHELDLERCPLVLHVGELCVDIVESLPLMCVFIRQEEACLLSTCRRLMKTDVRTRRPA